jgi:cytochrome oxidase Cu insertion factor (SCO1/SenC/PrrC family)
MSSYVSAFHPELQGWSGSEEQVDHIKSLYRVYSAIVDDPQAEADGSYLVNHSSMFYLVNTKGENAILFDDSLASEQLAMNIQRIMG